ICHVITERQLTRLPWPFAAEEAPEQLTVDPLTLTPLVVRIERAGSADLNRGYEWNFRLNAA
ncbi:MAG: hypothetical protein K0S79_2774, partial [Nitrospira sp.]|nr:hypothetical protein [Nitrospira sp.]